MWSVPYVRLGIMSREQGIKQPGSFPGSSRRGPWERGSGSRDQEISMASWKSAEFYFCVFMHLESFSVHKLAKKLGKYIQPS